MSLEKGSKLWNLFMSLWKWLSTRQNSELFFKTCFSWEGFGVSALTTLFQHRFLKLFFSTNDFQTLQVRFSLNYTIRLRIDIYFYSFFYKIPHKRCESYREKTNFVQIQLFTLRKLYNYEPCLCFARFYEFWKNAF